MGKDYVIQYNGMSHAIIKIAKEEGFRNLFKGIAPGIQRQIINSGLRVGLYGNVIKSYLGQRLHNR
jgi:hypothetical protein